VVQVGEALQQRRAAQAAANMDASLGSATPVRDATKVSFVLCLWVYADHVTHEITTARLASGT
jgi:hypothetical protein